MKLLSVENGMCRAYYQSAGVRYCFQETQRGQYALYLCTKHDGEPSHKVTPNQVRRSQVPTGSDYTSIHLAKWLEQEGLIEHEGAQA